MAAGKVNGLPNPRPMLSSQQSNSVPSTPHQRPRGGFESGSRSPSPRGLSGGQSPRSVFSEVHGASTNPLKGRPFCKYEKTPAGIRRRMQYNIGDAPLDDPPNKPKKALDPNEEKKLTGDMRELYDRLLPTEESERRRRLLVEKLEKILHEEWPGNEFDVHVFGSSGNLLCTSESDVDICIKTPFKELESMHILAAALDNHGMKSVSCIPAKVPIVKFWDPEYKLAADLNVNNTLALENTRMIKTYIQIDERVRPLAMIIKHWTKQRILNDAGELLNVDDERPYTDYAMGIGGTISSYAWICMILNFLQTRKPPILPSLHLRPHKPHASNDGAESAFDDSLEGLENFGQNNKSSLGELLFQFFRYYGYEFGYYKSVLSVRQGKIISRQEKGWPLNSKDGRFGFCIEEPFNTSRNLGNSADDTSFRGIHLELRDAFINVCNLKLDKLMEEYQFPTEDKHTQTFFQKAPAVPKPTLTAAPASSGRKGSGSVRNNRHNNRGNQSAASSRRASAGSMYGARAPQPGYSPNPIAMNEFSQQVANNWAVLMQHTGHGKHHQILSNLSNGGFHPQAYHLATAHAHSVVQGGSLAQRDGGQGSTNAHLQRMFTNNAIPSEHIANGATMLPYMFQNTSIDQVTPMSQSASQDAPRTNPSSPLLASSIPARRGLQRTSVSNGTAGGSLRSQSQPARNIPQQMFMQYPIVYDPATGYPYMVQTNADGTQSYQQLDGQYGYLAMQQAAFQHADSQQTQNVQQKEYLGYYVETNNNASQQMPPPSSNMPLPRSMSHTDLAHRRDKNQRDLQHLNLNGNKNLARSPSPLGHARNFSTPLRSAPLPGGSISRVGPSNGIQQPTEQYSSPLSDRTSTNGNSLGGLRIFNGSLIVNGSSFSTSPPEGDRFRRQSSFGYPAITPEENSRNFFDPTGTPHSDGSSQQESTYNAVDSQREHEIAVPAGSGYQQAPRMDSSQVGSTIGSPLQPFPSYNEMTPLASAEEEVVTSPTRKHQSPWQTFSPTNGVISPEGAAKESKDVSKTPGCKSAPVLSPVIENRLPTPQMQKRIDSGMHQRPPVVNGNLANGGLTNGNMSYRPSEPVPPTPASMVIPLHHSSLAKMGAQRNNNGGTSGNMCNPSTAASPSPASNQWQTTGTGKRKGNRKRSKSGPATRSAAEGQPMKRIEPLPARLEDRKGG